MNILMVLVFVSVAAYVVYRKIRPTQATEAEEIVTPAVADEFAIGVEMLEKGRKAFDDGCTVGELMRIGFSTYKFGADNLELIIAGYDARAQGRFMLVKGNTVKFYRRSTDGFRADTHMWTAKGGFRELRGNRAPEHQVAKVMSEYVSQEQYPPISIKSPEGY